MKATERDVFHPVFICLLLFLHNPISYVILTLLDELNALWRHVKLGSALVLWCH